MEEDQRKCPPKDIQVSVAQGLKYTDDEDYINKANIDSENEFWSSFPRNRSSQNFVMGGSQRSDTHDMTPAQEAAALKKYKKERKAITNTQSVESMKSVASKDVATLPYKSQVGLFWGDQNKMIRVIVARLPKYGSYILA
jgi:hypothetical protein